MYKGEDNEAIMYFRAIFPRIKEKYGDIINEMIFIQKPGDLVFIPGGWWHVVVNLDDTIAITQNYANSVNFPQVWNQVRVERKKMAVKFLRKLKIHYPELYDTAIRMNQKDNFIMYDELKSKMLNRKRESSSFKKKNKKSTQGSECSSDSNSSSSSSYSV